MTDTFTGKTVLVTGGGSGIGRATALAFGRAGAAVAVAGRTAERLKETVQLLTEAGAEASAHVTDVTKAREVEALVESVTTRHGGLHIAFNNAGAAFPGPLAEIAEEDWRRSLDVNLTGVWLAMKAEVAWMRGHGGGCIVNMASTIGAHRSVPGMGAYAAAKAAVSSLTRTAAREYIGDGIRINAISPGPIDTPASLRPGESVEERDRRIASALPIGRVGSLQEVADAVLWLASPASGFAVGHDLVLDGGSTA
ncbi:SDR family oxidoreductase [Streptomyces sp. NPDC006476]|uniref:SDR family NAD(P)-dependent oxidoreductase n=1 Tax=Streptomyces sp. NPDC006476 TaxID=3157175 RepID=UPI0033A2BE0A